MAAGVAEGRAVRILNKGMQMIDQWLLTLG